MCLSFVGLGVLLFCDLTGLWVWVGVCVLILLELVDFVCGGVCLGFVCLNYIGFFIV